MLMAYSSIFLEDIWPLLFEFFNEFNHLCKFCQQHLFNYCKAEMGRFECNLLNQLHHYRHGMQLIKSMMQLLSTSLLPGESSQKIQIYEIESKQTETANHRPAWPISKFEFQKLVCHPPNILNKNTFTAVGSLLKVFLTIHEYFQFKYSKCFSVREPAALKIT